MSVRNSLLAILMMGQCYGSQLKAEFERRTGGAWPLNVGQVYTTLARAARDGLVEKQPADASGRERFEITDVGRNVITEWLRSPTAVATGQRDDFVMKAVIAMTIPGVDVSALLAAQEAAANEVDAVAAARSDPQARLVVAAQREQIAAQLRWIQAVRAGKLPRPWGLDAELPKRGRPAKATAPV